MKSIGHPISEQNIKMFLKTSFYAFQFSHLEHGIPETFILPFADPDSPFYTSSLQFTLIHRYVSASTCVLPGLS